jgi:hypothetical protein
MVTLNLDSSLLSDLFVLLKGVSVLRTETDLILSLAGEAAQQQYLLLAQLRVIRVTPSTAARTLTRPAYCQLTLFPLPVPTQTSVRQAETVAHRC